MPLIRSDVRGRHGVHGGIAEELDGEGHAIVPDPDRFIVRGGEETLIVVHESDGVDRRTVHVVPLDNLPGIGIELIDHAIRAPGEKVMALIRVRGGVQRTTVKRFPALQREGAEAGARLRVPEFDRLVVRRRRKARSVVVETDLGEEYVRVWV